MEQSYTPILTEEERAKRRALRAQARRKKQLARRRRFLIRLCPVIALCAVLAAASIYWAQHASEEDLSQIQSAAAVAYQAPPQPEPEEPSVYTARQTQDTVSLGDSVDSTNAVLIDLQTDTILAQKDPDAGINPASMTKLLTLLVAAERVTDLDDTFSITREITDYCYVNGCSVVGLEVDETVPVRELLYGTILPSGADAALGLATYVAGSHESFVALMNEKAQELGISETAHFTNCVGLYDPDNHCTVYDMAVILKAAMDNALCQEVLAAHTYETLPTSDHPEGQILSNWFLRRIEDHDSGDIEVIAAKTGYVAEAGSCAASCGQDPDGNRYLCVTADASSSWQAIYDHADLYKTYCG